MEVLFIKGGEENLEVQLDNLTGELSFKGVSLPENVADFFDPILKWVDNYVYDPAEVTIITFDIKYYNTASSKYFLDILERLSVVIKQKRKIFVNWCFDADDEDIEEAGITLQELTKLPFNFNSY